MTDHKAICHRLRVFLSGDLGESAAVLIEQQAARIADLEKDRDLSGKDYCKLMDKLDAQHCELVAAKDRIAELESALTWKPMSDCPQGPVLLTLSSGRQVVWYEKDSYAFQSAVAWLPIPEFKEPKP